MKVSKLILVLPALFISAFSLADTGESVINFFTDENTAWHDVTRVSSKKHGVVYCESESAGEIWYEGTIGKGREDCKWASKEISVGDCEQLKLEYKVMPGALFCFETHWDKKPSSAPVPNAIGDGEWHEVTIPAKGSTLRIICSITGDGWREGEEKIGGVKKVFMRSLRAESRPAAKVNLDWLGAPLIIPEPKELQPTGKTIVLAKDGKTCFDVRLNSGDITLKKIIASEIAELCGADEKNIRAEASLAKPEDCGATIDLRLNEGSLKAPDKKESYVIECKSENGKDLVILAASDKTGLYWAWQTLAQLISKRDGGVLLTAANIKDWPDKPFRCLAGHSADAVKKNMSMKINSAYYPGWTMCYTGKLYSSDKGRKYFDTMREMCKFANPRGGEILQEGPGWPFLEPVTVSDDKQMEYLFNIYEEGLKTGNRQTLLSIDDPGRDNIKSFTEEDRQAYNNDTLLAHAWWIKKISGKIYEKYPGSQVFVITSNYESDKGIDGYYNRIGVSPEIITVWTGEQGVTFDYPNHIIDRYEKGIAGRRYIMHDNTSAMCFGMYRDLTICEKHGEGYGNLFKREKFLGCKTGIAVGRNSMLMVKGLEVAEMLWNAHSYNAEKARQRAVAKVAGNPAAVDPIIRFSEEYIKTALKYPIDKRLSGEYQPFSVVGQHKFDDKELSRYNVDDTEYARLKEQISVIGGLLRDIKDVCRNPRMTSDFSLFYQNMLEIIEHLHRNNKPLPLVNPEGSFAFSMNNVPGGTHYKNWGNGKIACAIYGQQTPNPTLEASFQMESLPAKDVILTLEGQDCDKNIAAIKLELNRNKIYEGNTPFVQNGWKRKDFTVPAKYFQKDRNVIKITNTCQSSDFVDHWAIISEISMDFK